MASAIRKVRTEPHNGGGRKTKQEHTSHGTHIGRRASWDPPKHSSSTKKASSTTRATTAPDLNEQANSVSEKTAEDVYKEKLMRRTVYGEVRHDIQDKKERRLEKGKEQKLLRFKKLASLVRDNVKDFQEKEKVVGIFSHIAEEDHSSRAPTKDKVDQVTCDDQDKQIPIGEWKDVASSLLGCLDFFFDGQDGACDSNYNKVVYKTLTEIVQNVELLDKQLANLHKFAEQAERGMLALQQQLAEEEFLVRDTLGLITGDLDAMRDAIAKNLRGKEAEAALAVVNALPLGQLKSRYKEVREQHGEAWKYVSPEHLRKESQEKDQVWCWNCWNFRCACSRVMKESYREAHEAEFRDEVPGFSIDPHLCDWEKARKLRAQRLMQELRTHAPTEAVLDEFCKECESLEACDVCEALTQQLQSPQWQTRLMALYAVESLIEHKQDVVVSQLVCTSLKFILEAEIKMPECKEVASRVLARLGLEFKGQLSAQRLMDELCAQAAHAAPTEAVLDDFCKKCEPLEPCHVSDALAHLLQSPQWQTRRVALYAIERLIVRKQDVVVSQLVGTSFKFISEAQMMPECKEVASRVLAALRLEFKGQLDAQRLMDELYTNAAHAAPTEAVLDEFCKKCESLEPCHVGDALTHFLQSPQWQTRLVALCAIERLIVRKEDVVVSQLVGTSLKFILEAQMMPECKEVASRVLALLGLEFKGQLNAQQLIDELYTQAAQAAPTEAVLDDFCKKCEPLEPCHVSEALTQQLRSPQIQRKLVALYAVASLTEHKQDAVVSHLVGTSLKLIVEAQMMPACKKIASKVVSTLGLEFVAHNFKGGAQVLPVCPGGWSPGQTMTMTSHQESLGDAKSHQESPGDAKSHQEPPGAARSHQEPPRGPPQSAQSPGADDDEPGNEGRNPTAVGLLEKAFECKSLLEKIADVKMRLSLASLKKKEVPQTTSSPTASTALMPAEFSDPEKEADDHHHHHHHADDNLKDDKNGDLSPGMFVMGHHMKSKADDHLKDDKNGDLSPMFDNFVASYEDGGQIRKSKLPGSSRKGGRSSWYSVQGTSQDNVADLSQKASSFSAKFFQSLVPVVQPRISSTNSMMPKRRWYFLVFPGKGGWFVRHRSEVSPRFHDMSELKRIA